MNRTNDNAATMQSFKLESDGTYTITANGVRINPEGADTTTLQGDFYIDNDTLGRVIATFDQNKIVEIDGWCGDITVYSNQGSLRELEQKYERLRKKNEELKESFERFNKLPFYKRWFFKLKNPYSE